MKSISILMYYRVVLVLGLMVAYSLLQMNLLKSIQRENQTLLHENVDPNINSSFTPVNHCLSKHVGIIGGGGYAGSFFALHLHRSLFQVTIIDIDPNVNFPKHGDRFVSVVKLHSSRLKKSDIRDFCTILFLGGCTSPTSCDSLSTKDAEKATVHDVVKIAELMDESQHLIVASTAAILEGWKKGTEASKVNENLLNRYLKLMYQREKVLKKHVEDRSHIGAPRVSLLRFGTIIGNSPGQRTDLLVPQLFKAAYTTGFLHFEGHTKVCSFLTLEDGGRAIQKLVETPFSDLGRRHKKKIQIWNLASFDATVLKVASTVAMVTGASIRSSGKTMESRIFVESKNTTEGFSVDKSSFEKAFNFSFQGSLLEIILDFDRNVPSSITPKGPHTVASSKIDRACPVCRSTDQQVVVDLGNQPSAKDFRPRAADAMAVQTFPLKLIRCRVCNHFHLSHAVVWPGVFEHTLLPSRTRESLSKYSEWLAEKIVSESRPKGAGTGSILELGWSDVSQLDQFLKYGWSTFGVHHATNLAIENNHTIKIGLWPLDFPELPLRDELTAILSHNAIDITPDVGAFLKGCARVMGPRTKLFIRTSQCNIQQVSVFDTLHSADISFFTGHSFLKASNLAGLQITEFETIPLREESCLVTMELKYPVQNAGKVLPVSLQNRLESEVSAGTTSEFFASRFRAHLEAIRSWIVLEIEDFKSNGFQVGGYGAAAKGVVFFHYLIDGKSDGTNILDFMLDDDPLMQNTYCPTTRVPVFATKHLLEISTDKPLVLLLLTWDSLHEHVLRLRETLTGFRHEILYLLVPSPSPKLFRIPLFDDGGRPVTVRAMPFRPTSMPNPLQKDGREKVVMITHQRNEHLMLPFFIIHHSGMFDEVLVIDYLSDDSSLELIRKFAPPTWSVVNSTTGSMFSSQQTDAQVMHYEKEKYPDAWVVALTITEFFIHQNLRLFLTSKALGKVSNESNVLVVPVMAAVGNIEDSKLVYFESLPFQRHNVKMVDHRHSRRYLHHKTSSHYHYKTGRHEYKGHGAKRENLEHGYIIKFTFSPWPEVIDRLIKVGATLPNNDGGMNFGFHHKKRSNKENLMREYRALQSDLYDICKEPETNGVILSLRLTLEAMLGRC